MMTKGCQAQSLEGWGSTASEAGGQREDLEELRKE